MTLGVTAKRITTWYAWAGLLAVVLIGPVAYFFVSYQFIAGSLETEAEIDADTISQLISKNPNLWSYEQLRLGEVLSRRHVSHVETRRIVDSANRVIAASPNVLDSPVIVRSADLLDSGVTVARIEISRSLRPLLVHTVIVAFIGLFFGMLSFIPFYVLPLRAVRRAEEESRKSEARYRRLFDSTMDGIYQVNADSVFTMMNPAGARIFGYDDPRQIIGTSALNYWRDPVDRDKYRAELKIRKTVSAYPIRARTRNGEPIELESSSRILEDEMGNFLGIEGILRDVTERRRMTEKLTTLSITDELTSLYNRRGFFTLGEHLLKMADRSKKVMFILYADLDGLKEINDTLGHQEGDRALAEVAELLRETYRKSDVIARIGGDEFVVIPVGFAGDNVEAICNRLKKNIEIRNAGADRKYGLSVSIGIAYYDPEHPCSLDELLIRADTLMYEQKRRQRKVRHKK
jgi:diguanylate cyclase (GGDEF)-like protein/PAS domain S-box-containing protein